MNKKITYGLLAGVAAVALVALLNVSGLLARWENPTADWRARLLARPSPATEQIKLIAGEFSKGRIVSVLEGGYVLSALARSVVTHIKVLADL